MHCVCDSFLILKTWTMQSAKYKIRQTMLLQVGNRARGHGIGRHSSDEVQKIGCDDVQAISDFLGDKPFIMGEKPTIVSAI